MFGVPSIFIGLSQAAHARKSHLVKTYIDISKGWDDLIAERALIASAPFHDREVDFYAARGTCILAIIAGELPFAPGKNVASLENDIRRQNLERSLDTVLSYLEDLGLLCRRGYVSRRDVFDIIGSSVTEMIEIMLPYIRHERSEYEFGETIYANAL